LNTTASPTGGQSAATPRRTPWVWIALALGLVGAFALDGPVMAAVRPLHSTHFADFIRHTVRWLGIGYVQAAALLAVVVVGAVLRSRAAGVAGWALLALALSGIGANVLKVLVHRPRPWVTAAPPHAWLGYLRLHELQSFPSGEATTSFAIALVLAGGFPWLRLPLFTVAAIVAAARVMVGDHVPSDVWAGAMVGIAVGQWVLSRARARARRGGPGDGAPTGPDAGA